MIRGAAANKDVDEIGTNVIIPSEKEDIIRVNQFDPLIPRLSRNDDNNCVFFSTL